MVGKLRNCNNLTDEDKCARRCEHWMTVCQMRRREGVADELGRPCARRRHQLCGGKRVRHDEDTLLVNNMASLGTNIDTVTNCVLVQGDVASIQYIRHFRSANALSERCPCMLIHNVRPTSAQEFAEGRPHVVHPVDDGSFEQYHSPFPCAISYRTSQYLAGMCLCNQGQSSASHRLFANGMRKILSKK
jgi:hypothetical protein